MLHTKPIVGAVIIAFTLTTVAPASAGSRGWGGVAAGVAAGFVAGAIINGTRKPRRERVVVKPKPSKTTTKTKTPESKEEGKVADKAVGSDPFATTTTNAPAGNQPIPATTQPTPASTQVAPTPMSGTGLSEPPPRL